MAQAGNIIQYVGIGINRQWSAYGEWYKGKQESQYYDTQNQIAWRTRNEAAAEMGIAEERDFRMAGAIKQEALNAEIEAQTTQKIGEIKLENMQTESDAILAENTARMAKSGMDLSYGSPMEYLNQSVNDRARAYGLQEWENDLNTWQAKRKVAALYDKSSMVLDQINLRRWQFTNLDYETKYQMMVNKAAAKDARRAATMKQVSHYIGAFTDSLNVCFGGGGGGGGGMNMGSMMNSNSGSTTAAAPSGGA